MGPPGGAESPKPDTELTQWAESPASNHRGLRPDAEMEEPLTCRIRAGMAWDSRCPAYSLLREDTHLASPTQNPGEGKGLSYIPKWHPVAGGCLVRWLLSLTLNVPRQETNHLSPHGCITRMPYPSVYDCAGWVSGLTCSPPVTGSSLLPGSSFQLHSFAGRKHSLP